MYSGIEAKVALTYCSECKKIYGIRFEKTSIGWKFDWAFKISEDRAKNEKYDNTKIVGAIYQDDAYPGCPYCGNMSFYICGACSKLNCDDGRKKVVTCGWCGNTGMLGNNYGGEGISSSGDV